MEDGNEKRAEDNLNLAADAGVDASHEGRSDYFMDIDRMVNEGLGGGNVTPHNGLIDESTTDTMEEEGR